MGDPIRSQNLGGSLNRLDSRVSGNGTVGAFLPYPCSSYHFLTIKRQFSTILFMKKHLLIAACLLVLSASNALALKVNDLAPTFFLRDANGDNFYLSDHVGANPRDPAKGVVLVFFASWCGPCKKELPELNALVDEFARKGVKTVIIGLGEDFDTLSEMLDGLKVDKPIVLSDKYKKVSEKYGVVHIPVTIIVGADGRVRDIVRGEVEDFGKMMREKVGKLK